MINTIERKKDVISIISSVDITPTMYKNACDKYNALAVYLNNHGIDAEIYPQGSFAIGTVVKPNLDNSSAIYDLDFICQIKGNKNDFSPSELSNILKDCLSNSEVYKDKLKAEQVCITIKYAEINEIGFSIDIVPATEETFENKTRLVNMSKYPFLIDSSIAIPKHNGERNYSWITNNPRGLTKWFNQINDHYLFFSRSEYRKLLFENNRSIFDSIEKIPSGLDRSPLQRVIQILKFHRDIYFSNIHKGDDLKPISAIITVLTAKLASHHNPNCSTFELLEYVINELNKYSILMNNSSMSNIHYSLDDNIISKYDGKWYIENPANPEDNLADKWDKNRDIPVNFFKWIQIVKTDLIDSLALSDTEFRASLENSFGNSQVSKVLNEKYCNQSKSKPILAETAPKPYGTL